jgi:hypothetical protein
MPEAGMLELGHLYCVHYETHRSAHLEPKVVKAGHDTLDLGDEVIQLIEDP